MNVFCYVEEHRGPSTFNVVVLARPGKDLKEVEKAVYAEVERVKSEPIADWELEKVRMMERRETAQQLQSTLYRAYLIGEMAVIFGDPNLINTRFDKIQSVSKEDIQRVAKTYLTEENRTVRNDAAEAQGRRRRLARQSAPQSTHALRNTRMNNNFQFVAPWAVAAALFAQVPQDPGSKAIPLSKVERKNKAPVSSEILRVKLPKPVEMTLPNGLTILVLEDHRLPLVTARMNILGAGALNDPADLPGLANVTATMLREGTQTRSSKQIAEEMEKLGATIGAQAPWGSETATFTASGLSDNAGQWIALASDVLLNPSFPASELDKLKQRMKVQLQQQRSTAGFLMQERFNRAVYGDHPAAITSATEQALDKITPAMLAEWHKSRYVPENAILGIAGDIKSARSAANVPGSSGMESGRWQGGAADRDKTGQRAADFSGGPAWLGAGRCRDRQHRDQSHGFGLRADGGDGSHCRRWCIGSPVYESARSPRVHVRRV